MIELAHFQLLGAALFAVGVYGVLARRSAVLVLMSIELMLNAVNLNLIGYAALRRLHGVAAGPGAGTRHIRHHHSGRRARPRRRHSPAPVQEPVVRQHGPGRPDEVVGRESPLPWKRLVQDRHCYENERHVPQHRRSRAEPAPYSTRGRPLHNRHSRAEPAPYAIRGGNPSPVPATDHAATENPAPMFIPICAPRKAMMIPAFAGIQRGRRTARIASFPVP